MMGPELAGHFDVAASGVLAPNGCIYFAPRCTGQVLCVPTHAQTAEMTGPELDGEFQFQTAGVLAPNDRIYFAPFPAASGD